MKPSIVVIGSGFGGAVSACRLAQAGFEVTVLERGRRFERTDFPALPTSSFSVPDLQRYSWQLDKGLWDIVDLDEVVSVQAAGLGGGSLIYANVHLRPPDGVFDGKWPAVYASPEFQDYYDLVASMLDVQPLPADQARKLPKVQQLRKSAKQLGRPLDFFLPPLAINFEPGKADPHGAERPTCTQCGKCSTGCPIGAKNTLDHNYLALAEKHGAKLRTLCEVTSIEKLEGGHFQVNYADHLLGVSNKLVCESVFVCAGAVHSTRLVHDLKGISQARRKRSGLAAVGVGYFPNADAIATVFDTKRALMPARGPTIGGTIVHWNSEPSAAERDFFLIQDGGYGEELSSLIGMLRAGVFMSRNRATLGTPLTLLDELLGMFESWQPAGSSAAAALPLPSFIDAFTDGFRGWWQNDGMDRAKGWLRELFRANGLDDVVTQVVGQLFTHRWMALLFRSYLELVREVGDTSAMAVADQSLHLAFKLLKAAAEFNPAHANHRLMLLAMGRDKTRGALVYDGNRRKWVADLDLLHLAPMYQKQEALMAEISGHTRGELRLNPAVSFVGKPVTVHSQGGCRMSKTADEGVTDENGQVHGVPGLYVLDGAALCSSVGVNPSATIMAVAERNVVTFIRKHADKTWGRSSARSAGEAEYIAQRAAAKEWAREASRKRWNITPPQDHEELRQLDRRRSGVKFRELLRGTMARPTDGDSRLEDAFDDSLPELKRGFAQSTRMEAAQRALDDDTKERFQAQASRDSSLFVELELTAAVPDLATFMEDQDHTISVSGLIRINGWDREAGTKVGRIENGVLRLFVPRYKPAVLPEGAKKAQRVASGGEYRSELHPRVKGEPVTVGETPGPTRYMDYILPFCWVSEGAEDPFAPPFWTLRGRKKVEGGLGPELWRDTSTLYVTMRGPSEGEHDKGKLEGSGVLNLGPLGFAQNQLQRLEVTHEGPGWSEQDPSAAAWTKTQFTQFFLGSLQQIVLPPIRRPNPIDAV